MNNNEAPRGPTTIRITPDDAKLIDSLAREQGVSRTRVARDLIRLGLAFARYGHTVNVTRAALLLEAVYATCEVILEREHADVKDEVLAAANSRFDELHVNA